MTRPSRTRLHLRLLGLVLWLFAGLAQATEPSVVSTRRGKRGGVLVLWPRVVPETEDATMLLLASALQGRLDALADRVADPALRATRPAPERVCPAEGGCRAVSLGAVLGHHEGGCFAVGLVGAPDGGNVRLVPWAGQVSARGGRELPHRQPPEDVLVVKEFVPCGSLLDALDDARLEEVLRAALAVAPPPVAESAGASVPQSTPAPAP